MVEKEIKNFLTQIGGKTFTMEMQEEGIKVFITN